MCWSVVSSGGCLTGIGYLVQCTNWPESGVNLIGADVSLFPSSFPLFQCGLKEDLSHAPILEADFFNVL